MKQLLQRETPDFITPDLWPPNSPDLNPADYRVCGVLQERIYRKSELNAGELKCSKVSLIKRLTNGEFVLMHLSKPKESILNNAVMMCCSITANDLL